MLTRLFAIVVVVAQALGASVAFWGLLYWAPILISGHPLRPAGLERDIAVASFPFWLWGFARIMKEVKRRKRTAEQSQQ